MSASWALVRFNRTGNVYYACYEGTSDILIPFICTAEECYDEKLDCYCSITYCRDIDYRNHKELGMKSWTFPDDVEDLDDVVIYSDYGGGFYWPGQGSESLKMIKGPLDPFEDCYELMRDTVPDWVGEFLIAHGGHKDWFEWRRKIDDFD